jgi:hypothetical protein
MTDFASQGRTRKYNVVDLRHSRDQFAVYTSLSRGTSYNGTLILYSVPKRAITGGVSGWIRQEFRDLEMLDEITTLRYNKGLPSEVQGVTRRSLIYQYRKCKGEDYIPKSVHSAIRWNKNEPYHLETPTEEDVEADKNNLLPSIDFDGVQQRVAAAKLEKKNKYKAKDKKKTAVSKKKVDYSRFLSAQGSQAVAVNTVVGNTESKKRKGREEPEQPPAKKQKGSSVNVTEMSSYAPIGFQWSPNYSCAYDSLFSIIHAAYTADSNWTRHVVYRYPHLDRIGQLFDKVKITELSMEKARDEMWHILENTNSQRFPTKLHNKKNIENGTSISDLCEEMFICSDNNVSYKEMCETCNTTYSSTTTNESIWDCSKTMWKDAPKKHSKSYNNKTIQQWVYVLMFQNSYKTCPECLVDVIQAVHFVHAPYLIPFIVHDVDIRLTQHINIQDKTYRLCGLIYFGHKHYTCQIVDGEGRMWYNDGQENDGKSYFQGHISNCPQSSLAKCKGRQLRVILYCIDEQTPE